MKNQSIYGIPTMMDVVNIQKSSHDPHSKVSVKNNTQVVLPAGCGAMPRTQFPSLGQCQHPTLTLLLP